MSSRHQTPDSPGRTSVLSETRPSVKQGFELRQPSTSAIPHPKGTDPGMDAIEDIYRLFMVEAVEHGAVADPQPTEQPSINPVSSMSSCSDETPSICQKMKDQESTSNERQKGVGLTEELEIPQYRIRRPLSG
ncbi:MAG: hypothetical protein Q9204_005141 [Flavoplaca sp. TL-2023a]